MMILRKFQIGPTSGKCTLIQINLNKPKRLYFLVKLRVIHTLAIFNNMPVVRSSCQKHLGICPDEKLSFSNHIKEKNFKSKQRYRYPKEIVEYPT